MSVWQMSAPRLRIAFPALEKSVINKDADNIHVVVTGEGFQESDNNKSLKIYNEMSMKTIFLQKVVISIIIPDQ